MTTDEIDRRIAEWMGWTVLRMDGHVLTGIDPQVDGTRMVAPRYTSSKDALQPVLERLGENEALSKAYIHAEYKQFCGKLEGGKFYNEWELMWLRRTLSAEQIARAVVEVLDGD